VYLAEMVGPKQRGLFSGLPESGQKFGWLLAVLLGRFLPWRVAAALSGAVPSAILLVGAWALPDTPEWLLAAGRPEAARLSVRFQLRDKVHAEHELARVASAVRAGGDAPGFLATVAALRHRRNALPTLALTGLFVFYALAGFGVIYSYGVVMMGRMQSVLSEYDCAVIVMGMAMLVNLVSSALMERCGRRALLSVSGGVCGVSMLALGFVTQFEASMGNMAWLPLPLLLLWMTSFSVGSPVNWTLLGEMLPSAIRHVVSNMVVSMFFVLTFASVQVYPEARKLIGDSGVYWFFGACSLVQVVYVRMVVSDTVAEEKDTKFDVEKGHVTQNKLAEEKVNITDKKEPL